VKALVALELAQALVAAHPIRQRRYLCSDKNPFVSGIEHLARGVRENLVRADASHPFKQMEWNLSKVISVSVTYLMKGALMSMHICRIRGVGAVRIDVVGEAFDRLGIAAIRNDAALINVDKQTDVVVAAACRGLVGADTAQLLDSTVRYSCTSGSSSERWCHQPGGGSRKAVALHASMHVSKLSRENNPLSSLRHPSLVRQPHRQRPHRRHQLPRPSRQGQGARSQKPRDPEGHDLPHHRQARPIATHLKQREALIRRNHRRTERHKFA
jgi:hypothetical protein